MDGLEDEATRRVLDRMEGRVKADLERLDDAFTDLRAADGIEIFNLSQEMLERCADLSYLKLDLQPFDQAILAAILVRAERLLADGIDEMAFCELDSHLQPWDKDSNRKERCTTLLVFGFTAISCFRHPPRLQVGLEDHPCDVLR